MQPLPILAPGDSVEIIAPASRCSDQLLADIKNLLTSWQLNCIVADDIFGEDLLCANADEIRFNALKKALLHPTTKAIICARGGYGSMRLIPALTEINSCLPPKLFVGMSDITALHLYLQQTWRWPTLHGGLALDKFSPESIKAVQSFLFGQTRRIELTGLPLNKLAEQNQILESSVIGGNLCIVQNSIGTAWQLNSRNKIIFLEEVNERGYRVDRMLEHLRQAGIFEGAVAILLGDFIGGQEPDGTSLIQPVLQRFAQRCGIPIAQIKGVGHGYTSLPLPLGTRAELHLGGEPRLICL